MIWTFGGKAEPVKKTFINQNKKIASLYLPNNSDIEKIKNILSLAFPGYPDSKNLLITMYSLKDIEFDGEEQTYLDSFIDIIVLDDKIEYRFEKNNILYFNKERKKNFLLSDYKKKINAYKKRDNKINPYSFYTFERFMEENFILQKKKWSFKESRAFSSFFNFRTPKLTSFFSFFRNNNNKKNTGAFKTLIISIIASKLLSNSILLFVWNSFFISISTKSAFLVKDSIINMLSFNETTESVKKSNIFYKEMSTLKIFLSGVIRAGNPFAI